MKRRGNSTNPENNYLTHRLFTVEQVKSFMFAGMSYITVKNTNTGNRYTFRLLAPKRKEGKGVDTASTVRFVSVMTGNDNTSSYTFLGSVFNKERFAYSQKSHIGADSIQVRGFQTFFNMLNNNHIPSNVEVWHEGKCGRCGRKLTVPESIIDGIGPECSKRTKL
jgi:hypothetical protein